MMKKIETEKAPTAIGPYSQAIATEGLIFVSGQLPIDPATGEFPGNDIVSQTKQSLKNMKEILASKGLDMSHIVKTTVFMSDLADFVQMNEVYGSFFPTVAPARSTFQVAALPMGALVEIEAIAERK